MLDRYIFSTEFVIVPHFYIAKPLAGFTPRLALCCNLLAFLAAASLSWPVRLLNRHILLLHQATPPHISARYEECLWSAPVICLGGLLALRHWPTIVEWWNAVGMAVCLSYNLMIP